MGLKKSIVVVNEYTVKTKRGGSRGGTPGDFVLRYMARSGAVEDLTPVQKDIEPFILRYMARRDATEKCTSVNDLKQRMRDIQGYGGVAFGYGEVSLTDAELKAASKDIQANFDKGKTVFKTVLSFDEKYLKANNVVSPDFEFHKDGDYRGNIDQGKLRFAIMNGLRRLGRHYDDLQYVGVIQVDTAHVHCHLAMVDRGVGKIAKDGKQKGKISASAIRDLRRGIDSFLDEKQTVKMMTSSVDYDKRNTICFVKKYTHKVMNDRGFVQFVMACLPENRKLWRASTNRKEMQKPNAVVRDFVTELLRQKDSGYKQAVRSIGQYVSATRRRDDLSAEQSRELYNKNVKSLVDKCVDGVYSILKTVPDTKRSVRTPVIETMSMPYEDMANIVDTDPVVEFGFKLRSYSSRLNHHKEEKRKYHNAVKAYDENQNKTEDSLPYYLFLKNEEDWNDKLMCKYQHFLNFIPPRADYEEGFDELMAKQKRLRNLRLMFEDSSIRRMKAENAEAYGRQVYDQRGGKYMTFIPAVVERRLNKLEEEYKNDEDAYREKLYEYGLTFDGTGVKRGLKYEFDDVKALDLHHLTYDYAYDFTVSVANANAFIEAADRRYELYEGAKDYLIRSGQADVVDSLPARDIEAMKDFSDRFKQTHHVLNTSRDTSSAAYRLSNTVRLDDPDIDIRDGEIKNMIKNTINNLQFE